MLKIFVVLFCLLQHFVNGFNEIKDCDNEESEVEQCAQQFLLVGRQRMPQTMTEIEIFCKNYKIEENCVRNHSMNCLSPSAHQTVTILINSIEAQNEKICTNWRYKKRIVNGGRCANRHYSRSQLCLQQFIGHIQGIHRLGQTDKIPIICCNYHKYRTCATEYLSDNGNTCNKNTIKTIENLIDGYSGDIIKYVCDDYRNHEKSCHKNDDLINLSRNSSEEIPKSFFSLMVKIYLS